jgi:Fe-S-cluster containining protein
MIETEHQWPQDARAQAFGYTCHACSRCCKDKIIQVNPYEVARLARSLDVSTTDFRARYTDGGAGVHLSRTEDTNTCVFLGPKGCTVHADRPLVCRLYPLGRNEIPGGKERWLEVTPHPQSAGEYHGRGTIAQYLEAQGAGPFLEAADGYVNWVRAATEFFADPANAGATIDADPSDMDAAITAYCTANGITEPGGMEERRMLHMKILYQALGKEGDHGN